MDSNYPNIAENTYQPPAPARRVGTFTLGVCLILMGILISVALYFGDGWWQALLLSPLILICLGAEILYYAFKYKNLKYRYDGLSVFFILLITFAALFCSCAAYLIKNAAAYTKMVEDSRILAITAAEKAAADNNCTAYVNGNTSASSIQIISAMLNNDKDFKRPVTVSINFFTINGTESPDEEQIFKTFADVASACSHPNISSLSLSFSRDKTEYHAVLSAGVIAKCNAAYIKNITYISGSN